MLLRIWLIFVVALASTAGLSRAQPVQWPPNGKVTAVNANTGIITAQPVGAGPTFYFKWELGAVPATVTVDHLVWRRNEKVSLNAYVSFCCTIVPSQAIGILPLRTNVSTIRATSYAAESTARARECDAVAQKGFTRGGHRCTPSGALMSSGKKPDGSGATYSWTCACS